VAEAQLIFCPYNYLVDPIIRDAMKIDLTGSIVIIDEAHNIDDVSRDAARYIICGLLVASVVVVTMCCFLTSMECEYAEFDAMVRDFDVFSASVQLFKENKAKDLLRIEIDDTTKADPREAQKMAIKLKLECFERAMSYFQPVLAVLKSYQEWLVHTADNQLTSTEFERWSKVYGIDTDSLRTI